MEVVKPKQQRRQLRFSYAAEIPPTPRASSSEYIAVIKAAVEAAQGGQPGAIKLTDLGGRMPTSVGASITSCAARYPWLTPGYRIRTRQVDGTLFVIAVPVRAPAADAAASS